VRAKRRGWDPDITFHFHPKDMEIMQRGLGILSDICWAAGAEAILPGLNGIPEMLHNKDDAELIRTHPLKPSDTIAASNHAMSTTRMSRHPDKGVVDADGRCHDMDNVYIADTGIFAGSSGVNPMLTVMALADRMAQRIAQAS